MGDAYQFLSKSNVNTIFLKPTNSTEILYIIDNLKVKATSDLNVATIKKAVTLIADIINVSFFIENFKIISMNEYITTIIY